jgi:hypothetical protein
MTTLAGFLSELPPVKNGLRLPGARRLFSDKSAGYAAK